MVALLLTLNPCPYLTLDNDFREAVTATDAAGLYTPAAFFSRGQDGRLYFDTFVGEHGFTPAAEWTRVRSTLFGITDWHS